MSARRSWRSEAIRRAETMALTRRLLAARDADRAPGDGEAERITAACRDAVKSAVVASYSTQETRG